MEKDTVVALRQPGKFEDLLTDILRQGARKLLAQAVEAEVADFLAAHADLTTGDGRQRLVRHGHLPERTIQTGIGSVEVQQPRVRDRRNDGEEIRCHRQASHRAARGCLSYETAKITVFKMIEAAQKSWRKLDGQNQLPKVIEGIKFTDGIEASPDHAAA